MSASGLESYFSKFASQIIGNNHLISTPYHQAIPLLYADWTAGGRMYAPMEERLIQNFLPLVANTHTDINYTGSAMTYAYHEARQIIKKHVGAGADDVLISFGSGMTGVVNKFQRILGLRLHENFKSRITIKDDERPVVFITHMEHHSNQTSWLETIADVIVVEPDENCLVSVENFKNAVNRYADRKLKIAAITSCSNVTGLLIPYYEIARIMHEAGGKCFVDFACSAPYIDINMHPDDSQGRYLDAIYFSPHKFLGGPGSTGILVFNKELYHNAVPDSPGGGTVDWTNPWGGHKYVDDIEGREDGGTPAFLQTIRVALCIKLKEEMGTENIRQREKEILDILWERLSDKPNIHLLAGQHRERLGVISFYIDGLHYNMGVKLLNDRFGIQTRGGCSCAGTYGHYLFSLSPTSSDAICSRIVSGDLSNKPGWIRVSIHPTHTNREIEFIAEAINEIALHFEEWQQDYVVDYVKGSIRHKNDATTTEMQKQIKNRLHGQFVDGMAVV